MVQTRGSRIICHYCGKRSALKYDGSMREFVCSFCDATNHFDKFGDITHPPVSKTTHEPVRPKQYAIPRASSPVADNMSFSFASFSSTPPTPTTNDIFCPQCLKNQSMFTSCLANYEESDESDEDEVIGLASSFGSAAGRRRERRDVFASQKRYYTFRKNLEARYPQMCADCEPRVVERVRQAGYTAKTDHLRRMMDRSRATRAVTRRRSPLNWADSTGRYLWWGGLGMQLGWHVACIALAIENASMDDTRWNRAAWWASWVSMILPADRLGSMALWAAVLACWWNPEWVKVFKGFSKHILNLPQWYAFQAMLIALRLVAWKCLGNMEHDVETLGGETPRLTGVAVISGHVAIAFIASVGYVVAHGNVRIDTTPLFGKEDSMSAPPTRATSPANLSDAPQTRGAAPPRRHQTQTLSDILDEMLAAPVRRPPLRTPATTTITATNTNNNAFSRPYSSTPLITGPEEPKFGYNEVQSVGLGGLSLSGGQSRFHHQPTRAHTFVPSTPRVHVRQGKEAEEMDWSPIPGPARALHTSAAFQQQKAFGAAPTQENHGAFWFKVPAAPVAPLTRAFKPTTAPMIVDIEPKVKNFGGFGGASSYHHSPASPIAQEQGNRGVTFDEPRFFAPERTNDPANKLADMLGSSWTIGPADDSGEMTEENTDDESSGPRADVAVRELVDQVIPTKRHARVAQAVFFGLVSLFWYRAIDLREVLMMSACLIVSGMMATWDLSSKIWAHLPNLRILPLSGEKAHMKPGGDSRTMYAFMAIHVAELGAVIQLGSHVRGGEGYEELGFALFGVMGGLRLLEGVMGLGCR